MNPSAQTQTNQSANPASLFERGFESTTEYEQPEAVNDTVSHTEQNKKEIADSWNDFYRLKSSDTKEVVAESFVNRQEFRETRIESEFSNAIDNIKEEIKPDNKPIFVIENQKGSGSIMEETGLKLNFPGLLKETTKTITGVFSLFKEIFMDTVTLVVGKKDKKAEKIDSDPAKAKAAAEKKAEKQRKNSNIRAFYEGLRASISAIISPEAAQMDAQEKENINRTAKIGNESYKGIKNSFGRLTVYASSMFERAQLDQEKQMKKIEKEQKMASVGKPDLNLDKAAEGGFLSSTGGQGAG